MELVSLGRLVLVMHLTLIGYAIGYFQNQNPHGYPDLLRQDRCLLERQASVSHVGARSSPAFESSDNVHKDPGEIRYRPLPALTLSLIHI